MARKDLTKAIAYFRTSSATNVGEDKDTLNRQRAAVEAFAKVAGYELIAEYRDDAVKGSDPVDQRPGFAAMLKHIAGNGVRRSSPCLGRSSGARPDGPELTNSAELGIQTNSFRGVRGRSIGGALLARPLPTAPHVPGRVFRPGRRVVLTTIAPPPALEGGGVMAMRMGSTLV